MHMAGAAEQQTRICQPSNGHLTSTLSAFHLWRNPDRRVGLRIVCSMTGEQKAGIDLCCFAGTAKYDVSRTTLMALCELGQSSASK